MIYIPHLIVSISFNQFFLYISFDYLLQVFFFLKLKRIDLLYYSQFCSVPSCQCSWVISSCQPPPSVPSALDIVFWGGRAANWEEDNIVKFSDTIDLSLEVQIKETSFSPKNLVCWNGQWSRLPRWLDRCSRQNFLIY